MDKRKTPTTDQDQNERAFRKTPTIYQDRNERELKKAELCHRILRRAQTQLYMEMRYLDVPVHAFGFMPDGQVRGMGTDGKTLIFFPDWILELYQKSPVLMNRSILHLTMHCLLGHLWSYTEMQTENPELMDLAFDITTEYLIDGMEARCIRKNQSFVRKQLYQRLREDGHVITPGRVLQILLGSEKDPKAQKNVENTEIQGNEKNPETQGNAENTEIQRAAKDKATAESGTAKSAGSSMLTSDEVAILLRRNPDLLMQITAWRAEFTVDDHHLWRHPADPKIPLEQQKRWKEMAETMQTEIKLFAKEAGSASKGLEDLLEVRNRRKYSYRNFLQKFAVLKEEMKADLDTFDTIYYCYGLEHFGNVPLIEPQETCEVKKVEDFVIAIDTSMSTDGELVRKFLEETYSILTESGSFHTRVRVHIVQCDERIQDDTVIHSPEEMDKYLKGFTVKGRGGTDFRPVFGYVNQLMREKAFTHLKGMLYFTDGYGTYPAMRPLFETAFIFFQEDYKDLDVPSWAMKLVLTPEDLLETTGDTKRKW